MHQVIKQGKVIEDDWQLLRDWKDGEPIPEGKVIVPLAAWIAQRKALSQRPARGIWLDSDQAPTLIEADIAQFDLIAINFPAFTDGRGFSYARLLRERHEFAGELRAIGDVLKDQLFYMKRCGFDAFAMREDQDPADSTGHLQDFSESYQAAADQPVPLFRRRAHS